MSFFERSLNQLAWFLLSEVDPHDTGQEDIGKERSKKEGKEGFRGRWEAVQ